MGMGFAPTWLRQVSQPPASQNHFIHCMAGYSLFVLKVPLNTNQPTSQPTSQPSSDMTSE